MEIGLRPEVKRYLAGGAFDLYIDGLVIDPALRPWIKDEIRAAVLGLEFAPE